MAFKIRRQRRRDNLVRLGFLKFEAFVFSSVTSKEAPYLKDAIKERQAIVNGLEAEAVYGNWSNTRYNRELRKFVRDLYIENNWLITKQTIKRKGKIGQADPWQLLHYYHDEYVDKNPSWESPSRKRRSHGEKKHYWELDEEEKQKIRDQKAHYRAKKAREREH